jgi:hypothetical protein
MIYISFGDDGNLADLINDLKDTHRTIENIKISCVRAFPATFHDVALSYLCLTTPPTPKAEGVLSELQPPTAGAA